MRPLVSGVKLQEKRTCSRCRQTQSASDHKSLDHRCQSGRLLQKTLVVEHDDANMVTSIRLGTEVSGGQCDMLPQPSEEETPEAHPPQSQGNVANVSPGAGSSAQNQEQDQVL
ncbi:hypothetical protein MHYP_G00364340 [Metynnis hypsauchen]